MKIMRTLFVTLLSAISIISVPAPAAAEPLGTDQMRLVQQICRTDVVKYMEGDKDWLEKLLSQYPDQKFRDTIIDLCRAYLMGLQDGIAVSKSNTPDFKCKSCITKTRYEM